jgi:hypothetical protein
LIDYLIYLDPYSFSFANTNSLSFSFDFCAKDKGTEKKRAGLAHEWYGNLYFRLRGSDFCPIGVASGSETMRSQKTELACLVEVSCKRAPWFENLFRNPKD